MSEIHWREPLWLYLAILPWLFFLASWLASRIVRQEFSDQKLLPWVVARRTMKVRTLMVLRFVSLTLAWLCFAIALAGPRSPKVIHTSADDTYTDVMVVVDVSRSMAARDITPSRIERARLELTDFLQRAQRMRIGIIVYAAQPHLLLPVTSDKAVLLSYLQNLRTGLLPTEGSDLLSAMFYAGDILEKGSASSPKAILLVSDGDIDTNITTGSHTQDNVLNNISGAGINIFSLGMATATGSSIPDPDTGWLKHDEQIVTSRLNANLLKTIALRGKGKYAAVSDTDNDWRSLYNEGLALLASRVLTTTPDSIVEWQEKFHLWLITGAFLFLLAHTHYLSDRRVPHSVAVLIILVSSGTGWPQTGVAGHIIETDEAYRALRMQQYEQALKLYARVPGFTGRMGEGSSAYFLKQYHAASYNFIMATLVADSDQQRSEALFNLANTYFKTGKYSEAASVYQDVLRYQPDYKPAINNLVYARALEKKISLEQEMSPATRAGQGPRSGRAAENMDLSQGGISLGDSVIKPEVITLPEGRNALITEYSLDNSIQSTTEEKAEFSDENWQYEIKDSEAISVYVKRLTSNESVIWQRLFELEEGFVAPVEQPHNVPGSKPW